MKKGLFLIPLTLLLAIILVAIGCPSPTPTTTPPTTAPTTSPTTTPPQPIELSFSYPWGSNSINYENCFKVWRDEISKRTDGRVDIVFYFNESLAPYVESISSVESGICDLAILDSNVLPGMFPMMEIWGEIPPSSPWTRWGRCQWEMINNPQFPEYMAAMPDVKLLFAYSIGTSTFGMSTNKPIRSVDDLKGVKLVCLGDAATNRAIAWGAAPTPVWPAEFFSTMEKGVVDGAFLCRVVFFYEFGLPPLIKYVTTNMNATATPFAIIMNQEKWNSLPPDVKQVFNDTTDWAIDLFDDYYYQASIVDTAFMTQNYGTEFVTIPPAELARFDELAQPVTDAFLDGLEAKGLPAKVAFEEYMRLVELYKY